MKTIFKKPGNVYNRSSFFSSNVKEVYLKYYMNFFILHLKIQIKKHEKSTKKHACIGL